MPYHLTPQNITHYSGKDERGKDRRASLALADRRVGGEELLGARASLAPHTVTNMSSRWKAIGPLMPMTLWRWGGDGRGCAARSPSPSHVTGSGHGSNGTACAGMGEGIMKTWATSIARAENASCWRKRRKQAP